MWMGSRRQNTTTPLGLRWSKSVKALGIVFSYNDTDQLQKNVYDKLKDIQTQIRLWNCQGLSLFGKVTMYCNQITSGSQNNVICVLSSNNSRRIYLWKGTDKIARLAALNDLKYGGLNLIDLETC